MKTADVAAPSGAQQQHDVRSLLMGLHELRQSQVDPAFWSSFCQLVSSLCRARGSLVVERDATGEWAEVAHGGAAPAWLAAAWPELVEDVAARAGVNGFAYTPVQDPGSEPRLLAAVRVLGAGETLVLLDIGQQDRGMLNELLMRAMLVADVSARAGREQPGTELATVERVGRQADGELLAMLDLVSQVMRTSSFELATLKLVNGISAHHGLVQAAFGWAHGSGQRAVAVSHLERFERKTENIRLIEAALEESATEEVALCHPPAEGVAPGGAALAALCDTLGYAQVCVLPQRDRQGNVQSTLLLAFPKAMPRLPEPGSLLLALEMLQPWLADLQGRDRWWGARTAGWAQGHLEKLLGPGNTWIKAGGLAATVFVLWAIFGTWDYKVEATVQVTTDSTRMVSAQFDGRVEDVQATAGDLVKKGAVLAVLDTRDLRQQEVEAVAERRRYEAEAARHRADENLADMEIALARLAQADARLARLQDYIANARSVAPFDGVVVEGERKDLLGLPVKKGDHLFRVAQVQGLYALLHVPERDIRDIHPGAKGELSLLSRPDQRIAFELKTVIPVAQVKGQDGNQFMLTASLAGEPESWWRPGMTGVARIEIGERNVFWVMSHRLVDTLRMKLWW